jgi:hypothetical protein
MVRHECAEALGAIGDASSLPLLEAMASPSESGAVRSLLLLHPFCAMDSVIESGAVLAPCCAPHLSLHLLLMVLEPIAKSNTSGAAVLCWAVLTRVLTGPH